MIQRVLCSMACPLAAIQCLKYGVGIDQQTIMPAYLEWTWFVAAYGWTYTAVVAFCEGRRA